MTNRYFVGILIECLSFIFLLSSMDVFAQSPAYTVLPSTIDFGSVYKNEMQWERTYVESYWAYTLTVDSVKITGDWDFKVNPGDDSCSGNSFGFQQRCPIKVTFIPIAEGPRQAVLEVISNGGINRVNLKGIGVTRPVTITATVPSRGVIVPSGVVNVPYGGEQTFTITPDTGWHVRDVSVDDVSQGAITSYTFKKVTASHTISVNFAIDTFTITVISAEGGTISPLNPVTVYYNSGILFDIRPDRGYLIADVHIDGVSVGAKSSYLFTDITADHTITATFIKNEPVDPNGTMDKPHVK